MHLSAAARIASYLLAAASAAAQLPAPSPEVVSFLAAHCAGCHGAETTKGGLDLDAVPADVVEALWRWSRLAGRVVAGEMPPAGEPRPAPAERAAFLGWIDALLAREVPRLPADPGRVTVRRLSRNHWHNTVRDLFGVPVPTEAFPPDDLGYGFDSIGDALTFSTLHLETYLVAARQVAAAVFHGEDPGRPARRRLEAEAMRGIDGQKVTAGAETANLLTRARIEQEVELPRDGNYRLRVIAGSSQAGDEPARMAVAVDGRELDVFEVDQRSPRGFELITPLAGGWRRFSLAFLNDHYEPQHPDPSRRDRNLYIDALEFDGPLDARPVPPEQRWLHSADQGADQPTRLRAMLSELLPRLWRRRVAPEELERLAAAGDDVLASHGLLVAQRFALTAALVSPSFLFRIEAPSGAAPAPLAAEQLASRLSFFLWASAPDDELLDLASTGRLVDPEVLVAAVDRMLRDDRADALATDFAAQWLELRLLAERSPDPARFPEFDEALRQALRRETELLVRAVLRDQRDVRDLLLADFTHLDGRLARFYGLPHPGPDDHWIRVRLPAGHAERGGVLGHGAILAVTSNPTRTSPVKRGKWILDNLLGQPPPPPPPGNDSFAGDVAVDSAASLREQMAQHRERAACAVCHVRMDALGLALERYDAIGRRRERDAGGEIDSSGELPDGRRLDGLTELRQVIAGDPAFVRTLAHKLFVYAVGRDLRPVDRLRLDLGVAGLLAGPRVTMRDLVLLVVSDEAFRRQGGGG